MKVWTETQQDVKIAADECGIELHNFRRDGGAWAFQARVTEDTRHMRRRGRRRITNFSPCYHLMAEFIEELFDQGAVRVQTILGNWTNKEEFADDLGRLAFQNIGSVVEPLYRIDACDCKRF